jgi:hypothetical protein
MNLLSWRYSGSSSYPTSCGRGLCCRASASAEPGRTIAAAAACCCLPPVVGVELQSTAEELQSAPGSHSSPFVTAASDGWAPRTSSLGNRARHRLHCRRLDSFGYILLSPPLGHAQGGDFTFSSLPFLPETAACVVVGRRDAGDARDRRAGRWPRSSAVGPASLGWVMRVADVFCLSEMHKLLESSIFAIRVIHCTHMAKRVLPLRNASSCMLESVLAVNI